MTTQVMESKIAELKERESVLEEAKAVVEALKDELKAEMTSREVEELECGTHIVRFTSILSNRFDTTTFKKEHAEMHKQYTKQTQSRRFTVS